MDKAHKATDDMLEAMERELAAIYREAQKGISDKAEAYFEQFQRLDEKKRKLVADGKLSEDEYLKWRKNKILYSNRFVTLQGQITAELARVNQTAAAYINDQLPDVYALNYNYVGKGVQRAVKGYSFTMIDANTVKRLATKTGSLLPKRKVDVPKDKLWNAKNMRAQVLQGILQGESMDKIADRMQTVTDMNGVSAIRNARTMVTGAENAGRIDMMHRAAADGVIMRKRWIATTDSRTRDWHRDLDGKEADIDEPFQNDFGDIMFPGDPTAAGANVYNCRCTLGYRVVGFEKAQVQEAMAENQAEEPKITTREQAYKTLTDGIGFGSVSDNVSVIDEKLLTENVTQLKKLNDRFGALTVDNHGYFTATSAPRAVAYSQGNFRNLNNQSMSLCGNSYGRGYDFLVSKEKKFVSTNWSMPCIDKNLPIYTVTHEYGHIFENKVIRGRVDMDVFEQAYKAKMLEKNGAKKARDFLKEEEKKQAKTIWQEITKIAKEENPDFLVSKNISEYGKTNYFEAFAETFANSQCGSPNELGKAMNIWLERNGY